MEKDYKALCKETKVCKTCGVPKLLECFLFIPCRNRRLAHCKPCYAEKRKPAIAKYTANNKEKIAKDQKAYCKIHSEKKKQYAKEYYQKDVEKQKAYRREHYLKGDKEDQLRKRKLWYQQNKEKHSLKRAEYAKNNKDRLRAARRKWENERLKIDLNYRLHKKLAGRIRDEMKGYKKRTCRTEELLGCSIEELIIFIEAQFTEGMNWGNWNVSGWHIDHRIPISWFNLENENCRKLAFSYKNLQPLWSEENLKKKNFYSHKLAS